MFITIPTNQCTFASGPDASGVQYWRALTTSISWPWFVMSLIEDTLTGPQQTDLLVSSSDDLRDALVEQQWPLVHLGVVFPPSIGSREGWRIRVVRKVWCKTDPNHPSGEQLIFEDNDGEIFTVDPPRTELFSGTTRLVLELPVASPESIASETREISEAAGPDSRAV